MGSANSSRSPASILASRHLEASFHDISNCVRMAAKYGTPELLKSSLGELRRFFPSTLAAWDKRRHLFRPGQAIIAVNLARLTNAPSILPAALYSCCQLSVNELLGGYSRPDAVVETLSAEDLRRCLDGKVKLCMQNFQRMNEVLHTEIRYEPEFEEVCTRSDSNMAAERCVSIVGSMRHQWAVCIDEDDKSRCDALRLWNKVLRQHDQRCNEWDKTGMLCDPCMRALQQRDNKYRDFAWSELSSFLQLE